MTMKKDVCCISKELEMKHQEKTSRFDKTLANSLSIVYISPYYMLRLVYMCYMFRVIFCLDLTRKLRTEKDCQEACKTTLSLKLKKKQRHTTNERPNTLSNKVSSL